MKVKLSELFLIFAKVGSVLFGGGYVMLPILESEFVKNRNWINSNELVEYYSVSQCLPGITAANFAMFVGYKLRGKSGLLVSGIGLISVPCFLIICFASILSKIINSSFIQNLLWGIGLGAIVLVIIAVRDMWKQSIVDKFSFIIFLIALLATAVFNISPVITVFGSIFLGLLQGFIKQKKRGHE